MRRPLLASLVGLLVACGNGGAVPGTDGGVEDGSIYSDGGGPESDAATPLSWVDFTVSGCTPVSVDPPRCSAPAPAELGFVAIAPAPIDTWLWSFGDGSPLAVDPDPRHEFVLPGVYDVTLTVSGPGGTAQKARPMRIEILAAGVGATCRLDAQCAPAGECICGEGEGCEASIAAGLCARVCDGGAGLCAAGQVCADLSRSGFDAPWRRALCLAPCAADVDCPAGRTCRSLLGKAGGWVRGCFVAGLVEDIGGSCNDATGTPDPGRCASARCAPLGARGMCTATCTTSADCSEDSACASFNGVGVGRGCVARCDAFACSDDPWLACTPPGGPGRFGFTVDESPAPEGYCAPRTCTDDADCGPDGACKLLGTGKFCQAP